jgi:hypothetical protein
MHPLHVEPVAWIAERKELLAGLFWFATGSRAWYVRRRHAPGIRSWSSRFSAAS